MTSSEGFQQHFSIISKFVWVGFYMNKNVAFTLIPFAVLKWDDCLSVQLPLDSVASARTKLNHSKVIELEFEQSRNSFVS